MSDSPKSVFAVDRSGRRRLLGPGDVLQDGESIRVGVLAMDVAPASSSQPPADASSAAYGAMCAQLDYRSRGQQSSAPQQSPDNGYAASCAALDYRTRSATK